MAGTCVGMEIIPSIPEKMAFELRPGDLARV